MTSSSRPPAPLSEQLDLDERMLRDGRPSARVGIVPAPTLSLGVAHVGREELAERSRAAGIVVVRRSSGGTAVLLGAGDLTWSVVLPLDHPRAGRDYVRAYERLGSPLVELAEEMGGPTARWTGSPGVDPEVCLLGHRGQVLTVGGRIVGGAAQHRSSRALLHHGFLLRTVDWDAFGRCFPEALSAARSRLAGWEEVGWDLSSEELGGRLRARLEASLAGTGAPR